MIEPLFDEDAVLRSGLNQTAFFRELLAEPAGLIDIGARWGVSPLFRPLSKLFSVLAFEADQTEAARLAADEAETRKWARFVVADAALGARSERRTLHILEKPNNSSIYPVNPHYAERYAMRGFELVRKIDMLVTTLDSVLSGPKLDDGRLGEVLKVDVQGAEFDVLVGGQRMLSERTHCVLCEAAFVQVYDGAKLFSEIETYLRELGFALYGFLDVQQRSTKRLDKHRYRARERFMHADAVFIRDPFEWEAKASKRGVLIVMLMAMLLGYFDLCLELSRLAEWSNEERRAFESAVKALCQVPAECALRMVADLQERVRSDPSRVLIEIGRFIDQNRDFQTYHDVI